MKFYPFLRLFLKIIDIIMEKMLKLFIYENEKNK